MIRFARKEKICISCLWGVLLEGNRRYSYCGLLRTKIRSERSQCPLFTGGFTKERYFN